MKGYAGTEKEKWITRYSKEAERSFFFYATIVMAIVGAILYFFGN